MPAGFFPLASTDLPPQILQNPSAHYAVITPHDSNDLAFITRGIYVGGAGTLTVITPDAPIGDASTVLFSGIPAGTILPIRASKIKSTGTSATLIVALY